MNLSGSASMLLSFWTAVILLVPLVVSADPISQIESICVMWIQSWGRGVLVNRNGEESKGPATQQTKLGKWTTEYEGLPVDVQDKINAADALTREELSINVPTAHLQGRGWNPMNQNATSAFISHLERTFLRAYLLKEPPRSTCDVVHIADTRRSSTDEASLW